MKYIFYADIFFLTNFMMDYFSLKITGYIRKKKVRTTSYLLGSLFGAGVLTCLIILPVNLGILGKIAAYFAVSFLMCRITFGKEIWKERVISWGCMYLTAIIFGGILVSISYYVRLSNLLIFFCVSGISYLVMRIGVWAYGIRMGRTGTRNDIIEVVLRHRENECRILALYDSGNNLKEPLSHAPVHIIDFSTAKKLLQRKGGTQEKIRIIPFFSLGKEDGILTAFECENVILLKKGSKLETGPAYLGIYKGKLCAGNRYQMILNRSINRWL